MVLPRVFDALEGILIARFLGRKIDVPNELRTETRIAD